MRKHFHSSSVLVLLSLLTLQCHCKELDLTEESNKEQVQSAQSAKTQNNKAPAAQSSAITATHWKKAQHTSIRDGITMALEVEPLEEPASSAATSTGQPLRIRLSLHDATTRTPLTGCEFTLGMRGRYIA